MSTPKPSVNLNPVPFLVCLGSMLLAFCSGPRQASAQQAPATNTIRVSNSREIREAMKNAKPGDVLLMTGTEWKDEAIVFEGNGTAEAPVTLTVEQPGKLVLTGHSSLHMAGSYLVVDGLQFRNGYLTGKDIIEFRNGKKPAHYSRLTNTVIQAYNTPDANITNRWVSIYGTHNRVDHCELTGKTNQGATLVVWLDGKPNYNRIDSNYFGPRPDLGRNGGESIRIGTSTWSLTDSYTTVEDNFFDRCNGEIEVISNKSGHNTYRHNTFYECQGTLTLRHGNYAWVDGNFFFGNGVKGTGGIRLIGSGHVVTNNYLQDLRGTSLYAAISVMNTQKNPELNGYWPVDSATIANNTIVNCREGIVLGSGVGDRERVVVPSAGRIFNNVVYGKDGKLLAFEDQPENMQYASNIIFGPRPGFKLPQGFEYKKPGLKYNQNKDKLWRPQENDPILVNAGFDIPGVRITTDMDQQNRADGHIDIGADEQSTAPVTRPISKGETGPKNLK